jgi:hypothetical protein
LGEVFAETGIEALKQRDELVANAVAGEREMPVGRVFAPGLAEIVEISLNFGTGCGEERAEHGAFGKLETGGDACQTLCPSATEKLGEDGFSLVVESVSGGDGIERGLTQQAAKPPVAEAAGSFFNALGGFACGGIGLSFDGDIDTGLVKGEAELGGKIAREGKVVVSFFAAQTVMEMGGVEHEAEFLTAAERMRRRATESAPPERPTARRMPGLSSAVSMASAGDRLSGAAGCISE